MFCLTLKSNQVSTWIIKHKLFILSFISVSLVLFLFHLPIMTEEKFDILLPSNVRSTNPDQVGNSIGNYITHLGKQLNLSNDWEVGLSEITFNKSWFNINDDEIISIIDENGKVMISIEPLQAGYYKTVDELINKINDILSKIKSNDPNSPIQTPTRLKYLPLRHKIIIEFGKKYFENTNVWVMPQFSDYLNGLLGLYDSQKRAYNFLTNHPDELITAVHDDEIDALEPEGQIQLDGSISALYVYCNIIEPVMIGDSFGPLLRAVAIPTDKSFGDLCEKQYARPYYYNLLYNEINSIEIDIRDDANKPVDFKSGRVLVTLHFRKKIRNGFQSLYELLH
jgi:hypothetical protein